MQLQSFNMRASIIWLVFALALCALVMTSCGDGFDGADDVTLDGEWSGYAAPSTSTCLERLYYPIGLRTIALADFCYGAGGLQALHDQYRFSYADVIDAATTLPMESIALGEARRDAGAAR
jgi:hypothetical protein